MTKDSNPVADVLNSKNIIIDKLTYNNESPLLLRIGGDRSSRIVVTNTDTRNAKQKVAYEFGATESNVTFQ